MDTEDLPTIKFLVLGEQGSGKTCFVDTFSHWFGDSVIVKEDASSKQRTSYFQMESIEKRFLPLQTSEHKKEIPTCFNYFTNPFLPKHTGLKFMLELWEIPPSQLESANDPQQIMTHLENAHGCICVVDVHNNASIKVRNFPSSFCTRVF